MPKVKKLPYYQMESPALPFAAPRWKGRMGSQGCVAINTQQTVSMDRPAPGEPPPPPAPKPPKPTPEQIGEQKAGEARQKALATFLSESIHNKTSTNGGRNIIAGAISGFVQSRN